MPDLTETEKRFILHWGEMGTRWGVNRTVAQIHALLYLSPRPLHAEEITETLSVSRSNVSMSLKELQSWGLVQVAHELGDRRDHFLTSSDVWELFLIVAAERKKREFDPTVSVLRQCMAELESPGNASSETTAERIGDLLAFLEVLSDWYEEMRRLPLEDLKRIVRMGSRIRKLLGRERKGGK